MAPVDGRLPTAITHLSGWVSTSTPFKSCVRWGSSSSGLGLLTTAGDEEDFELLRFAEILVSWLKFLFLLGYFVKFG